MSGLIPEPSLADRALSRLIQQFKGQENISKLLTAFADELQEVQSALYQVLNERSLGDAVGAQLDDIAALLNISREGKTDNELRSAIQVEIVINFSKSRDSDVVEVLQLLTQANQTQVIEQFPAGINVFLDSLGLSDVATLQLALDKSTGAAVEVHSVVVSDDDGAFGFEGDPQALGFADEGSVSGAGTFVDQII